MRKFYSLVIAAMCSAFSISAGAENFIVNGDFSTIYNYEEDPGGYPGEATPIRTWVTNNQGNLMFVDNTDPENPANNALLVEAPGCKLQTWYSNYVCYRFKDILKPGIYTMTFDAKYVPADGCPDKQITIYWRTMANLASGGAARVPMASFVTTDQKMCGTRQIVNLKEEWTTYTMDWDFNYLTDQFYTVAPDAKNLQPVGDLINDLYLAVMPSSSVSFYLDNVKLTPKDESSIAEFDADSFNVFVSGKTVFVNNATEAVEVYDLAGRLVMTSDAPSFALNNAGFYVVKCGTTTQKIVVE